MYVFEGWGVSATRDATVTHLSHEVSQLFKASRGEVYMTLFSVVWASLLYSTVSISGDNASSNYL